MKPLKTAMSMKFLNLTSRKTQQARDHETI